MSLAHVLFYFVHRVELDLHIALEALASEVVLDRATDLAFVHERTIHDSAKETSLQLHLYNPLLILLIVTAEFAIVNVADRYIEVSIDE